MLRILAAMVNPRGGDPERETVLLLNASPERDRPHRLAARRPHGPDLALPPLALNAGASIDVELGNGMKLGNKGGAITLLDAAGLKVAGVSYTADQARREGWTVTF